MQPANVINIVHDQMGIINVISLHDEEHFAAAEPPPPQIAANIPLPPFQPMIPIVPNAPNVLNEDHDHLRINQVVSLPVDDRHAAAAPPIQLPQLIAAMIVPPPPAPPPIIPHRRRQQLVRRPVEHFMVLRNGRSTHYNLRRLCR
jgi:hypothetical protein|tara:strand:+ start:301 stop:735 length:435 start_codon:yes stop_codon:yes gene_type:complete